jgi:hypothetical protein
MLFQAKDESSSGEDILDILDPLLSASFASLSWRP